MASGDQLAQNLVEEKTFHELDFVRTGKFGALGLACVNINELFIVTNI